VTKGKKNEDVCQLSFEYGKSKPRKLRTEVTTEVLFLSNGTWHLFLITVRSQGF